MGLGNDFWIRYIKHRQGNKRKIDGTTQTKKLLHSERNNQMKSQAMVW